MPVMPPPPNVGQTAGPAGPAPAPGLNGSVPGAGGVPGPVGAGGGVTPPMGGGLPGRGDPIGKNQAGLGNVALGVGFLLMGLRDLEPGSDLGLEIHKFINAIRKQIPNQETLSGDAQKLMALRQRAMRGPGGMGAMGGMPMAPGGPPGVAPGGGPPGGAAAGAPPPGPPPVPTAGM